MRKTAGFLKFCCTVILVFEAIMALILAFADGILLVTGSLSELAEKAGSAISIQGANITPEQLDAFKPFILIALTLALVSLVLIIIGTLKTRTAFAECKEERPFSQKCVDALKVSARMEILSGLVGIASACVLTFMAANLKINGTSSGSSTITVSLTFVIYAVGKYLLYHIAKYGNSLERDPRRR